MRVPGGFRKVRPNRQKGDGLEGPERRPVEETEARAHG